MHRLLGWLPHLRWMSLAQRVDLELFRRTTKFESAALDATLPRLTRLANHSFLWALIAGVLALLRGRRGRRDALRGLLSVGATSFVTNIPVKLALRRARPSILGVPAIRRLARQPTSTSFPSGHSASAFAFASSIAFSDPPLGLPLLGVAGAVAYSRVYTGVHYPSDVLVGAALGTAVGFATRRMWPIPPDAPQPQRPGTAVDSERPGRDGSDLAVVVNPSAGNDESPIDVLRKALPGAELIEVTDDLPIEEALAKASASAATIGICGGDGTVNAAVRVATDEGKTLVVFPGGTLNHFAKDVTIVDLDSAIEAVRDGIVVGVDCGCIADRLFVNTASFGVYTDVVDMRERLERRIGKWAALGLATARALRHSSPTDVRINDVHVPVWLAFIGNCEYQPDLFSPGNRVCLDDGMLDVRLVRADRPFARARLVCALVTGTLERSRVYSKYTTEGPVRVQSLDGPIRLAVDGETFDGPGEFVIEKLPRRAHVLVPND